MCPLLAAAGLCSSQPAAGAPARPDPDPTSAAFERQVASVFRCIFEDRSRMVIVHPARDLYIAFNPGTCGIQKIWRGGMIYRGKVWDFSQDNCAVAKDSTLYAQAVSTLAGLPDALSMPPGWSQQALTGPSRTGADEGWRFTQSDSSLTSPEFDASGWQRVFVSFDETQRNGPFRVDISSDGGASWSAQSFHSTTHGSSDTDWQFNFKLIEHPTANMRIRWTLGPNAADKRVRRVRIFGDRAPWSISDGGHALTPAPVWRGYERHDGASADGPVCTLMYDLRLSDGKAAQVRHTISSPAPGLVAEEFRVTGLPPGGKLTLDLPAIGEGARRALSRPGEAERALEGALALQSTADAQGSASFTITTSPKEHP